MAVLWVPQTARNFLSVWRTVDIDIFSNCNWVTPGGSSTVHIYTQTVHRTTQNEQYIEQHNNLGECGPCPVLASYTLAFALQLRKKHGIRIKSNLFGSKRPLMWVWLLTPFSTSTHTHSWHLFTVICRLSYTVLHVTASTPFSIILFTRISKFVPFCIEICLFFFVSMIWH